MFHRLGLFGLIEMVVFLVILVVGLRLLLEAQGPGLGLDGARKDDAWV